MFGAELTHFDFSRGLFCEAAACILAQSYGKFLFCKVLAGIPEDLGQISALVNLFGGSGGEPPVSKGIGWWVSWS